jgi:hypothetical protein
MIATFEEGPKSQLARKQLDSMSHEIIVRLRGSVALLRWPTYSADPMHDLL